MRSDSHPDGLPNLKPEDEARVQAANKLYAFTARAVAKLEGLGIAWSIENPSNSLMWLTSWFVHLKELKDSTSDAMHYDRVSFHMCMHGGRRPKSTDLIFGGGVDFSDLERKCDGKHEHLPWGLSKEPGEMFVTASERNYPQLLARRMATRAATACGAKPIKKFEVTADKAENTEAQPRRQGGELVPEYKEIQTFQDVKAEDAKNLRDWNAGSRPKKTWLGLELTKGHRVKSVIKHGKSGLFTVEIGCPWTVEEFTKEALECGHPFDRQAKLPPSVVGALRNLASRSPAQTIEFREQVLNEWKARAKELEPLEDILGMA